MISVCIATYNGQEYISEQLTSILSQLEKDDEVIVSDDGSTDNTVAIVKAFNDDRIKIVDGPCNGVVCNFENALNLVKGDYIFLSDQDDIWIDNKVAVSLKYLEKYACIVSDAYVVDSNRNLVLDSFFKYNNTRRGFLKNLFMKNGYTGCCMAFRKEVLKKALPFPENIAMHDIWIGNVAEIFYSFKFVPERLVKFRRHGNNNTMTLRLTSTNTFTRKIAIRINIICSLLKRLVA